MSARAPRAPRSLPALLMGGLTVLVGLLAASVVVDELRLGVRGLGPSPFYAAALLAAGGWLVWTGLGGHAGAGTPATRRSRWTRAAVQVGAAALLVVPVLSVSLVTPACACGGRPVALMSDLRNLISAQELYYGRGNYTYAPSLERLEGSRGQPFVASEGVRVLILEASSSGFSAAAVSSEHPGVRCVVYTGDVEESPRTYEGHEPPEAGRPVCDPLKSGFEIGLLPGGFF